MSRNALDLEADVMNMALAHVAACAAEGIHVVLTQTLRTAVEQAALYAQGRTKAGPVVTHAPPGYSWHEFGRAYDLAIATFDGDQTPMNWYDGPWERVGTLGEKCGMDWGGRWKHPDIPHFEHHGGKTLAQRRGERSV